MAEGEFPGVRTELPRYIVQELTTLDPKLKRRLGFFGGHPVSITRLSCNKIFSELRQGQSPYLVCQKTDGVRYLLMLCLVDSVDCVPPSFSASAHRLVPQCYFISREGHNSIAAYACEVKVAREWELPSQGDFKRIVQILDGEFIVEKGRNKFLIFDALVHLAKNIITFKLRERLDCVNKFLNYNKMMRDKESERDSMIEMQIKDFFRLTCCKYITIEFMLRKYVKCLPHKNDGLIFNHQDKQYVLGPNDGYIKWKPAHLNTLDFMVLANQKLRGQFEERVLDLYLLHQNECVFYNFCIVGKQTYEEIRTMHEMKLTAVYQEQLNNQAATIDSNAFIGSLIAECKYEPTKKEESLLFLKLVNMRRSAAEIREDVMRPNQTHQEEDIALIKSLQQKRADKGWKIYKFREDKNLPNSINTAKKIEESIRDNITEEDLIRSNHNLMNQCNNVQN